MQRVIRTVMSCVATAVAGAALLLSAGATAEAATITFDTFASNTAITDQYEPQGVLFRSNMDLPAHILDDSSEAASTPNVLIGNDAFSDIFLSFVDPATGLPTTATDVSVYAISVGFNEFTLTARNLVGDMIEQYQLQHLAGPENGLGNKDLVAFTSDDIASISFVFTSQPRANDGIGIDDLSFSLENRTAVPEPATLALFGCGMIGLTVRRRSKQRRLDHGRGFGV